MQRLNQLVPSDKALLITGSLNSMEEDRQHDTRSMIHPVQIFMDGKLSTCRFFDEWGDLGVSALAVVYGTVPLIYVTTGPDLVRIELSSQPEIEHYDIPGLKDVHELTEINGELWLANTGYDELVGFDLRTLKVSRRIKLQQFRLKTSVTNKADLTAADDYKEVDRFHCNQVFEGMNGKLYALIHHVDGKQLIRRIANKFIKKQGNGGVVDITTGDTIRLGLKAPHSVRRVNGEYWVCDSGARGVKIYDGNWRLKSEFPTVGWGRGADLAPENSFYYVGISAQRKRYQDRPDYNDRNLIYVVKIDDRSILGEIDIPDGIEQVNNVYLISKDLAGALLRL